MIPPEWSQHSACWLAWPADSSLWQENLVPAQNEFVALVNEIAKSENTQILCPKPQLAEARSRLRGEKVNFIEATYGDIWLRDTAPIFGLGKNNQLTGLRFKFNGWGEKYLFPDDRVLSKKIISAKNLNSTQTLVSSLVTEGGALEFDEFGTLLTTEACLIDEKRNPGISKLDLERELIRVLNVKKVLWIRGTLINDHTDGHIDTLARFLPGGKVLCMKATDRRDPNYEGLQEISRQLRELRNAAGNLLDIIEIPSPGLIEDEDGKPMPASYMNYYISNKSVIVPTYGSSQDSAAVELIAKNFPDRLTVGLSARAILTGGGAFHCITQQEPATQNS